MTTTSRSDEELEALADQAAGYYIGLWNILKRDEAPPAIIINAAINNMMAILTYYMSNEQKLAMLETIIETVKAEISSKETGKH